MRHFLPNLKVQKWLISKQSEWLSLTLNDPWLWTVTTGKWLRFVNTWCISIQFFSVMKSELWISFFHEELKSLESFWIIHHDVIIERNHSIIIKPVAWSISLLVQTLTSSIWSGFAIINLDRWRCSDRGTVKRVTKWWRIKQYLGNNPYDQLVPYFLFIFTEMLFKSLLCPGYFFILGRDFWTLG